MCNEYSMVYTAYIIMFSYLVVALCRYTSCPLAIVLSTFYCCGCAGPPNRTVVIKTMFFTDTT